jgi:hypothetical protein
MMKKVLVGTLLVAGMMTSQVQAEETNGFTLGTQAGIFGFGAHLGGKFSDTLGVKVGFDQFTYNDIEVEDDQVKYNFDVDTKDILATLDWHPRAGSFALRAGVIVNDSNLDGTIKPNTETQSFTFNGVTYTTDDVAKVDTTVDFDPIAPYVGISWDTSWAKSSGFGFTFDLGVIYQGSAKVDYTVNYQSDLAKSLLGEELERNLEIEKKSLQDELDDYEYLPYIAIGVNYKF